MSKPANPSTEAPACKWWCWVYMREPPLGLSVTTGQHGLRACSQECCDAGRPLRPAPQPIETGPSTEAPVSAWCGTLTTSHPENTEHGPDWIMTGVHPRTMRCWCSPGCEKARQHVTAQPIERCSCAESIRYRAALEAIAGMVWETSAVYKIARRALALEPEGT